MENNFIGIFPNAAASEYCERLIHRFEFTKETKSEGRGKVFSRNESEKINKLKKDDETYFIGGDGRDDLPHAEEDKNLFAMDSSLLRDFGDILWGCYDIYAKGYGILSEVMVHKVSPYVRIQKTMPGQGYHMWHCDDGNLFTSRRLVVVSLYLNTVEEGGETEFLYQSTRVSPVEGTLVFFPAGWTHTHRGNPPLSGDKYLLTTWLEYVDG